MKIEFKYTLLLTLTVNPSVLLACQFLSCSPFLLFLVARLIAAWVASVLFSCSCHVWIFFLYNTENFEIVYFYFSYSHVPYYVMTYEIYLFETLFN